MDGFIARENGDLDWLPSGKAGGSDGDYGYGAFMDTVDFIVMGRHTFEKALTFDGWPYHHKRVAVLTTREPSIPPDLMGSVGCMSGSPADIVARLAGSGARHLYIDGGKTIQQFLDAGMLRRLIVTRIPILIGRGIPLFGPLQRDIRLSHIKTTQFESGFIQSEYEIAA